MLQSRARADALIREYYRYKGLEWPTGRAERLLPRILIKRDGQFVSREWRRAASEIFNDALFDVDDLVENHLGIPLRVQSLDRFDKDAGATVFGFADLRRREICICTRAVDYEPLFRATVLHEVGHCELHRQHSTIATYAPSSAKRPRREVEADQFMCAAMLPEPLFWLSVAADAADSRVNLRESLLCANTARGRHQWNRIYLPALMSRFCASKELVVNLVTRLGIIDQQSRQFHLSRGIQTRWATSSRFSPFAAFVVQDVVRSTTFGY